MTDGPQVPTGLNHLVLHVRDLDESHWFWTECLGFRHVGSGRAPDGAEARPRTRFYSGMRDGKPHHHHVALVEEPSLAAERAPGRTHVGLHHVAIAYPTASAWEAQIAYLTECGVRLDRRVHRGVTRSIDVTDPNGYRIELVHDLPREAWENDIDAALNKAEPRPVSG